MARTVVRRGALDRAWDTVLADFPPELHPQLRQYVEARRDFLQANRELEHAKNRHGVYWWKIDQALSGL